jgi:hypothetical protein
MQAVRWGDNDRYLGPFTWSVSDYRHWAMVLRSRCDGDGDHGACTLRLSLGKATLIVALPNIVRPWREKVYPQWDAETVARLGRDWYWNVDPRQYGLSLHEGHFSIYYGRTGGACMDSRIQQRWSCFLPWTQWRHVRHSLYGLVGEHFWTAPQGKYDWHAHTAAQDACPTAKFHFKDHDGEDLIATTRIEEREWRFGSGWFKWLSLFRRRKVRRSLDIEFSGETGTEKGSWKGGTIGTGIDMLPGELHESAFRRYCEQEHRAKGRRYKVQFVGRA